MASIDVNNYVSLNKPNILKIEEEDKTNIRIYNPLGYQVLEETLFTDTIDVTAVNANAQFISNRLRIIEKNMKYDHLKDYHFLWMLKNEIARVAFLRYYWI